jgi:hypothetical protein
MSIKVISDLIDRELATMTDNAEYVNAVKVIAEMHQPVYDRLAASVQKSLKLLLPSIKSVKIIAGDQDRYRRLRFSGPRVKVDDGTPTAIEEKGDGIKSLVAIALMRAANADGSDCDLIVAIEEPESHLHPDAIHQLVAVLRDIAAEHQLIVTTHSPVLVARERIGANIIVTNSTARIANTIAEIRAALGVRVQDNLISAEYIILAEGKCDTIALDAVFCALSTDFSAKRKAGRIAWDHMDGAGNVPYKLAMTQQLVASPFLILDDDPAGREAATKARTVGKLHNKYIFMLKHPGLSESELEDHYNPGLYWPKFEFELGGRPSLSEFEMINAKWSKRAKIVAERAGKVWTDSIEEAIKESLAKWISEDPLNRVKADRHPLFAGIAAAIAETCR